MGNTLCGSIVVIAIPNALEINHIIIIVYTPTHNS